MACQSSFTSGGLHLLSPTYVVWTNVLNTPSSSLLSVNSAAPSRTTASVESDVKCELRLQHCERFQVLQRIVNFHRLVFVHHDEPFELIHHLERTVFL